jgi:Arc/MetJ-type ribon-helix-helix transcriptional regulator
MKGNSKMSKKKKLDDVVHDAVEETLEQMGDQIADLVAKRLKSNPELSEFTNRVAQDDAAIARSHKMCNPGAGP